LLILELLRFCDPATFLGIVSILPFEIVRARGL